MPVCKQCGELRPSDQFRSYYAGRKGRYTTCKLCEKINSREKYLSHKPELNESEVEELAKINELYVVQRAVGLRPPGTSNGRTIPLNESLDDMISKYAVTASAVPDNLTAPAELLQWLTAELTKEPDFYLDSIYETMRTKYRPQLSVDTDTMLPVYDDTYKAVLDKVLERFNEYEDTYYDKE